MKWFFGISVLSYRSASENNHRNQPLELDETSFLRVNIIGDSFQAHSLALIICLAFSCLFEEPFLLSFFTEVVFGEAASVQASP